MLYLRRKRPSFVMRGSSLSDMTGPVHFSASQIIVRNLWMMKRRPSRLTRS